MDDHSWLSERTKTIIVVVVMVMLIGGMGIGYYKAMQWQEDRRLLEKERAEKIFKESHSPTRIGD